MQNPPKSQLFVRARALQYSRLRSAGHTKCNCALRAQKINVNCYFYYYTFIIKFRSKSLLALSVIVYFIFIFNTMTIVTRTPRILYVSSTYLFKTNGPPMCDVNTSLKPSGII